jgi:large subunit ribosomal protein L12
MIEVYGALMLHKAGQEITEASLKKVVQSAGTNVDEGKIKALVAALEGKNIDELIQQAAIVSAPKATTEEKKEDKKEDDSKKAEEASAGLSSLFG